MGTNDVCSDYLSMMNVDLEKFSMFVEKYDSLFTKYLSQLFKIMNFSEAFLQKYIKFYSRDIFYNQLFSEAFYIKNYEYFKDLNFMENKNEWKFERNRTSKLKIFIKLKGVK